MLSVHAGEVFADQEKALAWLQSPNPSLDGQEADDVLTRIETGVLG